VDDHATLRLDEVHEVSTYVAFLASDDGTYSTGTELVADGGFMLGPLLSSARNPAL
jgi:NAD(P)-dependent dehydrogenase (short-subunit alcohol dehydrogenase family)